VNAEADAINTLEGTSYHQGGHTVDDYLDNFQTLVSNAGYTDSRTLVVKFQRGLKLGIQNQIATIPYGRLTDTDPNAWYRAARRIDQARLANEAFQSVSCSTPSGPAKTVPIRPPLLRLLRSLQNLRHPLCHKLHSVISPSILRRFPRSQSQLKALKKTFRLIPVTSRGNQYWPRY